METATLGYITLRCLKRAYKSQHSQSKGDIHVAKGLPTGRHSSLAVRWRATVSIASYLGLPTQCTLFSMAVKKKLCGKYNVSRWIFSLQGVFVPRAFLHRLLEGVLLDFTLCR